MTRLVTCGFELNDMNESGVNIGSNTGSIASASPAPRSPGTYYLKWTLSSQTGYRQWTLPAAKTELWIRWGIQEANLINSGAGGEYGILYCLDSLNNSQFTVTCATNDHLLRVRSGGAAGTVLGTGATPMPENVWHTVEVHWKTTTTASSADGVIEVWLDGTRQINLQAVDSTFTSTLNLLYLQFGLTPNNYSNYYLDDIAINDTLGTINNGQIGDGRVVLLKPNAAGTNAVQLRGGTDTGANFSQCNELPMSMAQYVYSATAGDRDTYNIADLPAGNWSVNSVDVIALAQNSDALAGSLGLTVKSGVTTNEGAAQALSTGASYYHQLYETDPNTSAAWTNAAVNALEVGTTVR
jgi:hypothetical protein